ncbi:Homoserine/homoserine lactone efflux protein [Pandoraea eparura]|jgi:threonine/homoserine/homoserine lactone efflux protein|uniref:Homoserine/homoserine lactone efflux protein n=1 Tax=Pandoraea eparura TaxID=2508291 RepID=A0A5E4USQ9_9BURK|nr:LysE family translocator [Pandoraea eparura]VVE02956.1 Homoserine/homoserine lactone efflux protein [Pandoraea eparura]
MIDINVLPYFLATVAVLVAIPGPNTIYISTASASQGFRFGLASCFGVMLATLVHVALAAAGLTALLLASPVLFGVIKSLGAAYLIFLGIKAIRSRPAHVGAAPPAPARALGASIKKGFLVNLLNPKTGLFIAAFLPQFVNPASSHVPLQIATLGVLLVFVGALSDVAYAALAGTIGKALASRRARPGIGKYVTGLLYMSLGVAALATSSPPIRQG